MVKTKAVILWTGILLIVVMCFFPPWTQERTLGDKLNVRPAGYHCLLCPPISGFGWNVKIDTVRLVIQCAIVALLTGGLFYTIGKNKEN